MPTRRHATALRPRKQPLQARSRETVRVILRAAAQVFAARGYAASTTNHIADRAGVSIGSLYEYFPNKDALLHALLEDHIEEAQAILMAVAPDAALNADGLAAVVRRYVAAMVELHARDRALHRVLFEEAPLMPRIRRQLAAVEAEVTARVHAFLLTRREVTRPDAALAAAIVVQTIEGLTHKVVVHGEPDAALEPYIDEMVALVTAYLTAEAVAT
jgi:AcrR family transcriptional regulator